MTQLQLTRALFARLGTDLRRRFEGFVAITGPAIAIIVLLNVGAAAAVQAMIGNNRFPGPREVSRAVALRLLILVLQWLLAFFVLAALAVYARRTNIGTSYEEAWKARWPILMLAVLCGIVTMGMGITYTWLMRVPQLLKYLATPLAANLWTLIFWTMVSVLLMSVPIRMDEPLSVMDALANSVRLSGRDIFARFCLVALFAAVPAVLFPLGLRYLTTHVHSADLLKFFVFATSLVALLLEFIGLYGICLLYEIEKQEPAG